ncbi:MAG: DUF2180 family protein, partial [Thaumarchaeota archaeon]|nr:DUF2180 family protein [Nitrososphaerota archaeon]
MKCYVHPNVDAVGICSTCSRGVCRSCQVVVDGKGYCRRDAERLLLRKEQVPKARGRKRGIAISLAAVLAGLNGVAGLSIGFMIVIIWILGPLAVNSGLMASAMRPFLQNFVNVTLFPPGQAVIAGLAVTVIGMLDMVTGYYLWSRSRLMAVVSVGVSIAVGAVVADMSMLGVAGEFLYVYAASSFIK